MTEVFAPGTVAPKSVFPTSPHALPVGSRIGEFEVHRLIGEGGFGIVYLCYDQSLDRYVALKEYMPSSLATRENATLAIVVKSKHHTETFQAGMKSFINEARLLAQFDHPSLVKVYRFWQANGTAYMTMPFYEGPTLKQALAALGRPPDEATLRSWLEPMLDALEEIHRFSCYHRDIAPDNILLTAAGPLLLDFGAARRVIGDMTQALTVVLKPGFAPIEQYGDAATMSQGAWTDLYALASVVYYAIIGRPPMSAVDRLMDDKLQPLSQRAAGHYSHALLAAVDSALAVRPQDRPQNVGAFRALLKGAADPRATDLYLWADDTAPTEMPPPSVPAATRPGALDDPPRTVPLRAAAGTGAVPVPRAFLPTGPGTLPGFQAAPSEGPRSSLATPTHAAPHGAHLPPFPAPLPHAVQAPALEERTVLVRRADAMPQQPQPGRPPPVAASPAFADSGTPPPWALAQGPAPQAATNAAAPAAGAFGAGLAPLSGGLANPAAPRPGTVERTVMPSLLPPAPRPSAAGHNAAASEWGVGNGPREAPGAPAPAPQHLSLWLSGAALLLAALVAAWTFTRPSSELDDGATSNTAAPAPAPAPVVPPPAATVAPPDLVPAPVPAQAPAPVPAPAPVVAPPVATIVVPPAPAPQATPPAAAPTPPPAAATRSAGASTTGRQGPSSSRNGNAPRSAEDDDSPVTLNPRSAARSDSASPAPRPQGSPARCNDIRQRAGLEDLSAEERQFLRTQCR